MKKLLIWAIGTAFALSAGSVTAQAPAPGKLDAVGKEGRDVTIGDKKLRVSGSRTKITIAGKEADRERLKAGMECKVEAKGDEATKIDCK